MAESLAVILADDHTLLREMLREHLTADGIDVVACAATSDEAIAAAIEFEPDIVALDIEMPGRDAFDAARAISEEVPGVHVLFLSAFVQDHYIQEAIACGASGYLTKSEAPHTVADAIRRIAQGSTRFSREVMTRIVIEPDGPQLRSGHRSRLELLTIREREVLSYVARGMQQKQIAQQTGLSIKTVQHHIMHVMDKLAIHDRVELTRFAIREGLVQP